MRAPAHFTAAEINHFYGAIISTFEMLSEDRRSAGDMPRFIHWEKEIARIKAEHAAAIRRMIAHEQRRCVA